MTRQRLRFLIPIPLLLLLSSLPAAASPITVGAGQSVVVSFGTMPANWDPTDPPDYLGFTIGNLTWLGGDQTVQMALYDGDRLLGSYTGPGQGIDFLGAGQELPRGWTPQWAAPSVDFSSLLDGTIDGRLEFSAQQGAFRFDPALLQTCTYCPTYIGPHPVSLFDVTPEGGFWVARADFDWLRDVRVDVTPRGGPADVITPVPEPGTLSLMASGLVAGILRLRKRQKARND